VRRVTKGHLLSIEYVHAPLQVLARRRPLFELRGETVDFQWWLASDAGLRHLLHVGGFRIEQMSKPFLLRFGPGTSRETKRKVQPLPDRLLKWALTRDPSGGHLHRAYLCEPRF
jgi:hypothetical protein